MKRCIYIYGNAEFCESVTNIIIRLTTKSRLKWTTIDDINFYINLHNYIYPNSPILVHKGIAAIIKDYRRDLSRIIEKTQLFYTHNLSWLVHLVETYQQVQHCNLIIKSHAEFTPVMKYQGGANILTLNGFSIIEIDQTNEAFSTIDAEKNPDDYRRFLINYVAKTLLDNGIRTF